MTVCSHLCLLPPHTHTTGAINDESSECGHPFCEKMVLTASGDLYKVSNAIISNTPPQLEDTRDLQAHKFRAPHKFTDPIDSAARAMPGLRSPKSSKVKKAGSEESGGLLRRRATATATSEGGCYLPALSLSLSGPPGDVCLLQSGPT